MGGHLAGRVSTRVPSLLHRYHVIMTSALRRHYVRSTSSSRQLPWRQYTNPVITKSSLCHYDVDSTSSSRHVYVTTRHYNVIPSWRVSSHSWVGPAYLALLTQLSPVQVRSAHSKFISSEQKKKIKICIVENLICLHRKLLECILYPKTLIGYGKSKGLTFSFTLICFLPV